MPRTSSLLIPSAGVFSNSRLTLSVSVNSSKFLISSKRIYGRKHFKISIRNSFSLNYRPRRATVCVSNASKVQKFFSDRNRTLSPGALASLLSPLLSLVPSFEALAVEESELDFADAAFSTVSNTVGSIVESVTNSIPDLEGVDLTVSFPDLQSATNAIDIDPVLAAGAAGFLSFSLLLSLLLRKQYTGDVTAEQAFDMLTSDLDTCLLDIRTKADRDATGSPIIRGTKKQPIQIPLEIVSKPVKAETAKGTKVIQKGKESSDESDDVSNFTVMEDPEFAAKVAERREVAENERTGERETTVLVLDKFGVLSVAAAKILFKNKFKNVFVIKGGAEGPRGWKESGLPWKEPMRIFDVSIWKEAINNTVEETKSFLPSTLGVAAVGVATVGAITEAELILQLLGTIALGQFFVQRFLFAADRKKTIAEIKAFVDTKLKPAVKDLADEIGIASPSPASEATQPDTETDTKDNDKTETVKAVDDSTSEQSPEAGETMTEGATTTTPPPTLSSTDLPPSPTPLSPYTLYPNLKPPTSPAPKPPTSNMNPMAKEATKEEPGDATPEAKSSASPSLHPSPSLASTDLPPSPTPLSPYTLYPDLKPPSSPTPSAFSPPPSPSLITSPEPNLSLVKDSKSEKSTALASVEEAPLPSLSPTPASSSTDLPLPSSPLSPYTKYSERKPPASPSPPSSLTPSPPVYEI